MWDGGICVETAFTAPGLRRSECAESVSNLFQLDCAVDDRLFDRRIAFRIGVAPIARRKLSAGVFYYAKLVAGQIQ